MIRTVEELSRLEFNKFNYYFFLNWVVINAVVVKSHIVQIVSNIYWEAIPVGAAEVRDKKYSDSCHLMTMIGGTAGGNALGWTVLVGRIPSVHFLFSLVQSPERPTATQLIMSMKREVVHQRQVPSTLVPKKVTVLTGESNMKSPSKPSMETST